MNNHSLGIFEQFSRVSLLFGLSLVFLAKETFQLEGSTQCFNGSLPCLSCDGTSCAHCYYFENYLEDQKINGTTTRKVNCTARQNDVPNCLQQALLNGTKHCTICVHGYYFNSESKSCQKGSLKNCVFYERSPVSVWPVGTIQFSKALKTIRDVKNYQPKTLFLTASFKELS